jgi:Tol biopolymer transport system component/DNA-binding winged helix-turn-helix (wHTH) protein
MSSPQTALRLLRFGLFEMDVPAGELRKQGRVIKLQEQPRQVLALLLRRPGEVVTREELRQELWAADTFVEFDQGLNTAVKKIRLALGDSADNPRFIETIPRKGYRFIAPVTGITVPVTAAPLAQRRDTRLHWAAALFGLLVSIGAAVWFLRVKQMPEPPQIPVPLTSYPGTEVSPSFSPDGSYVAFAWNASEKFHEGNFDIFVKLIGDGGDPIRLTHDTADKFSPAWSPDGRFIAFLRTLSEDRSGVFSIPAIGGPERKLAEIHAPRVVHDHPYLSWFPNSRWLAVLDQESPGAPTAVFRISVETGEKQRLTSPPAKSTGDWDPAVSPDGRALAFRRSIDVNTADLFLTELSQNSAPEREPKRLTSQKNAYCPVWIPDGRGIIFSGPKPMPRLWKLTFSRTGWRPIDLERLPFTGEGVVQAAISQQGRLIYVQTSINVDIWRFGLNGSRPAQPPTRLIASTRGDFDPQYSPDGKHIAFTSVRSGSMEIWISNIDGSGSVQLTSFKSSYWTGVPRWSPDSQLIAFLSDSEGTLHSYVISADGNKLHRLPIDEISDWSRDGKWLYFRSMRTGRSQCWKVPWPPDGHKGQAIQLTEKGCRGAATESYDGKFIYYLKGVNDDNLSVWRVPVGGGEEIQVLGPIMNSNFAMANQGIYFIPSARPVSLQFLSFTNGRIITIAKIPREPAWGVSISPDGRSLLFSEFDVVGADLMLVEKFH